jgi:hypothetical protein
LAYTKLVSEIFQTRYRILWSNIRFQGRKTGGHKKYNQKPDSSSTSFPRSPSTSPSRWPRIFLPLVANSWLGGDRPGRTAWNVTKHLLLSQCQPLYHCHLVPTKTKIMSRLAMSHIIRIKKRIKRIH